MTQQGRFSVTRFIDRLDECFARNDFGAAKECLEFWENEARKLRDDAGLLTVLNEETGFFRRSGEETRAMKALAESLELTEKLGLTRDISGATVYINAATALSAFGRVEEAAGLYEKAAEIFKSENKTETYEYAALLNNRAAAYYALKRTDEAKADWRCAIEVLKKVGYHAGDIAVSLSMLAEVEESEHLLDEAWEYINSDDQPKDGRYAEVLLKCAPTFERFGHDIEAGALRDTAYEIYEADGR